jgi:hypothetical protein
MPLNITMKRDGKDIETPQGLGHFHIAAMVFAAAIDSGVGPFPDNSLKGILERADDDVDDLGPDTRVGLSPAVVFTAAMYGPIGATPLNDGPYTLKEAHKFVDTTDGEELDLEPGDVLHAWRSF